LEYFVDIHYRCLSKDDEDLCGDQVRVLHTDKKSWAVLSDGIGNGVKANILASLTSDIMIHMLQADVSMHDVMETIVGTLPVSQEFGLAYATFSLIEVDHHDLKFRICNFDNPAVLFFRNGKQMPLNYHTEMVLDREIQITEGQLQKGDFIAAVSDGVVKAGPGFLHNDDWDLNSIASYMEECLHETPQEVKPVVEKTMLRTCEMYEGQIGDDTSMVGLLLRESRAAMVLSGPPLDEKEDDELANRILNFNGTRIICGGTTADIVALRAGFAVQTDNTFVRGNVPPIGFLPGIDLLTEGILTLTATVELLDKAHGNIQLLLAEHNGASLLAQALLYADKITFVVGQKINPFYQNPLLPMSVSIRKNLIEKLAERLIKLNKQVSIEYH